MKKHLLTPFLICCSIVAFGQNNKVSIDFDGDGAMDQATLISSDGSYRVEYTLSSLKGKKQSTALITQGGQANSLSVSKNVLTINNQFMRGENHFKFRYDKNSGKVILIGYDNVQYGTGSNDGSGSSSYNLLTGQYEANWNHFDEKKGKLVALPKVVKRVPAKVYSLDGFSDKTIDQMNAVDTEALPKELR